MAHLLEQYGEMASFASLRQPAWHGLGTVFEDEKTTSEMLDAANLSNWDVRQEPITYPVVTTVENFLPTYAPTHLIKKQMCSVLSVDVTRCSKMKNCFRLVTTSLTVAERGKPQAPSKTAQSFSVRCL